MWVWVGGGLRKGESVSLLQLASGSKCVIMRLIVPLLGWRYKSTPAGREGDSEDKQGPQED